MARTGQHGGGRASGVLRHCVSLEPVPRRQPILSQSLAGPRRQPGWLIGGQDGAANRLGLPRTTLVYKMRKLGIETRRSSRPRPIRQLAEEQRPAAENCPGDAAYAVCCRMLVINKVSS